MYFYLFFRGYAFNTLVNHSQSHHSKIQKTLNSGEPFQEWSPTIITLKACRDLFHFFRWQFLPSRIAKQLTFSYKTRVVWISLFPNELTHYLKLFFFCNVLISSDPMIFFFMWKVFLKSKTGKISLRLNTKWQNSSLKAIKDTVKKRLKKKKRHKYQQAEMNKNETEDSENLANW